LHGEVPTINRLLEKITPAALDCWIGVVTEIDRRVVRLAGRLSVAQVPELLAACAGSDSLELDLTDLVSADIAGIEALQRVRAQGATLVGTAGYIQLKLDSTPGASGSPAAVPPRPRRQ
jgi:hypothetical protein